MKSIYILIFAIFLFSCSYTESGNHSFIPGELWMDNNGVHINAHGGGILAYGERYYWYGEHKIEGEAGNKAHVGVHVYSSENL